MILWASSSSSTSFREVIWFAGRKIAVWRFPLKWISLSISWRIGWKLKQRLMTLQTTNPGMTSILYNHIQSADNEIGTFCGINFPTQNNRRTKPSDINIERCWILLLLHCASRVINPIFDGWCLRYFVGSEELDSGELHLKQLKKSKPENGSEEFWTTEVFCLDCSGWIWFSGK